MDPNQEIGHQTENHATRESCLKSVDDKNTEETSSAIELIEHAVRSVQSEMRKFMDQQESGLETSYRCIRC